MEQVVLLVSGMVLGAAIAQTVHAWIAHYRRRKAMAAAAAFVRQVLESLGIEEGERVTPDQIRAGDRIHYHGDGGYIEYTAAHHGDAGNQDGGEWVRRP